MRPIRVHTNRRNIFCVLVASQLAVHQIYKPWSALLTARQQTVRRPYTLRTKNILWIVRSPWLAATKLMNLWNYWARVESDNWPPGIPTLEIYVLQACRCYQHIVATYALRNYLSLVATQPRTYAQCNLQTLHWTSRGARCLWNGLWWLLEARLGQINH